ncbi:MAG TPA: hypothetical protein EYQ60_17205 [Myxococcales bacterium]|nr:hypothetical protein [Myxococcales bacterium]
MNSSSIHPKIWHDQNRWFRAQIALLVFSVVGDATIALADRVAVEILDETGDGLGTLYSGANDIDIDSVGNVYVVDSDVVFRIDAGGSVTQIIDSNGDGGEKTELVEATPLTNPLRSR